MMPAGNSTNCRGDLVLTFGPNLRRPLALCLTKPLTKQHLYAASVVHFTFACALAQQKLH